MYEVLAEVISTILNPSSKTLEIEILNEAFKQQLKQKL